MKLEMSQRNGFWQRKFHKNLFMIITIVKINVHTIEPLTLSYTVYFSSVQSSSISFTLTQLKESGFKKMATIFVNCVHFVIFILKYSIGSAEWCLIQLYLNKID